MATPTSTCNSRFIGGFPRLAGIFAGKTRKNSSDTPTSGSHNSLVWTPICANLISLESRRRELSNHMLHDPFWAPKGLQNRPRQSGQKTVCAQKPRMIRWRGRVADKNATWQRARCALRWRARRATPPIKQTLPPHFQRDLLEPPGCSKRSLGKKWSSGVFG